MKSKITLGGLSLLLLIGCSSPAEKTDKAESTETMVPEKVVGVAKIEPEKGILTLTAGTDGQITEIPVNENSIAMKGDLIATVDHKVQTSQVNQAISKIGSQRSAIIVAEENVEAGMALANSAKISKEKAERNKHLNQRLFEAKAVTKETYDNENDEADKIIHEYENQKHNVEQLKALLEQAKNKLVELNADVTYQQTVLDQKNVYAPFDGKILSWDISVGDFVNSNTSLGEFAPSGDLVATTEIDELFAGLVKAGQQAEITSQSTGKVIATGEVVFTSDYLKKKSLFSEDGIQEDRRVRTVKVKLDPDANVLMGSKVDITILLQ